MEGQAHKARRPGGLRLSSQAQATRSEARYCRADPVRLDGADMMQHGGECTAADDMDARDRKSNEPPAWWRIGVS